MAPVVTTASIILCFNKHRLARVHLENGRYNGVRFVAVWLSSSALLVLISEVTLCQAPLSSQPGHPFMVDTVSNSITVSNGMSWEVTAAWHRSGHAS